jgi:hypothetical protein
MAQPIIPAIVEATGSQVIGTERELFHRRTLHAEGL